MGLVQTTMIPDSYAAAILNGMHALLQAIQIGAIGELLPTRLQMGSRLMGYVATGLHPHGEAVFLIANQHALAWAIMMRLVGHVLRPDHVQVTLAGTIQFPVEARVHGQIAVQLIAAVSTVSVARVAQACVLHLDVQQPPPPPQSKPYKHVRINV